jgi:hypothetical protein
VTNVGTASGATIAESNSNGTSRSMLGFWLAISATLRRSSIVMVRGSS